MIDEGSAIEAARLYVKAQTLADHAEAWLRHATGSGVIGIVVGLFFNTAIGTALLTASTVCSWVSVGFNHKARAAIDAAKKLHEKAFEP